MFKKKELITLLAVFVGALFLALTLSVNADIKEPPPMPYETKLVGPAILCDLNIEDATPYDSSDNVWNVSGKCRCMDKVVNIDEPNMEIILLSIGQQTGDLTAEDLQGSDLGTDFPGEACADIVGSRIIQTIANFENDGVLMSGHAVILIEVPK